MYLKSIEIFGFKSFAIKTKLNFTEGLSAIVGPNGCGKTNIVDAIRWVLGEKKASTLRSDIMENVIFNGNKDKKPLGMAEVSICFENTKGILPSEFNEIEITRRLYRNGESEYLINKTICRLKDILDLFMDTGIGPDSYSVIELKMIESILSGKIDDRRAMFEEAAGIKKYKVRRKETTKKLESIELDMSRLNDILLEVRKNVNSLSRQASKTKRYNQLLSELREIESKLLICEYYNLDDELKQLQSDLNKNLELSNKLNSEINIINQNISILKENLDNFESDFIEFSNQENFLQNNIAQMVKKSAILSEKISSIDNTANRLKNDIEILTKKNDLLQNENIILNIDISKLTDEIKLANQNYLSIKKNYELSSTSLRNKREDFNKLNNQINNINFSINNSKNTISKNNNKRNSLLNKQEINQRDINNSDREIVKIEENIHEKTKIADDLIRQIDKQENLIKLKLEEKILLESKLNELILNRNEIKNQISNKKALLDLINSIIDNSEVTKFLNDSNDWHLKNDKIIIGENITIDEKYIKSLLVALGDNIHNFVVDNIDEAVRGIELLKKMNKGKAGFVLSNLVKNLDNKNIKIEVNDKIKGWLLNLVNCDGIIYHYLSNVLNGVLVVSDLETGLKCINEKICSTAVTLEGELIKENGLVYGGSISKIESEWIGKKEKIKLVQKELIILEQNFQDIDNQIEELKIELEEIDINNLNRNLESLKTELINTNKSINQLELKKQAIENNKELYLKINQDIEKQIKEIDNENLTLQEEIQKYELELKNLQINYDTFNQELEILEKNFQLITENIKKYEIEEVELKNKLNNKKFIYDNNKKEIENNKHLIAQKEDEINQIVSSKSIINNEIKSLEIDIKSNEDELVKIQNKKLYVTEEISNIKSELKNEDYNFNELKLKIDNINQNLHYIEIQKTQKNTIQNNIKQRLLEEFQIETIYKLDEVIDVDESKNMITDLKNKLSQLGSVNFMALEEYEIQNERLIFYESQLKDLESSKQILQDTINEININAEKKFIETFEKIRVNFKLLFNKLFGKEGEADLKLVNNNNVLESDIIIIAKPPNKKPHSIEMLSGGEKTLTAIALLFAIYLVKPSPFCILDEVDAPLDDRNIDKFINMIRDFSNETQFLIVTHNKKTMEAANTLYGVTMQEDGISKVVAVKLKSEAA